MIHYFHYCHYFAILRLAYFAAVFEDALRAFRHRPRHFRCALMPFYWLVFAIARHAISRSLLVSFDAFGFSFFIFLFFFDSFSLIIFAFDAAIIAALMIEASFRISPLFSRYFELFAISSQPFSSPASFYIAISRLIRHWYFHAISLRWLFHWHYLHWLRLIIHADFIIFGFRLFDYCHFSHYWYIIAIIFFFHDFIISCLISPYLRLSLMLWYFDYAAALITIHFRFTDYFQMLRHFRAPFAASIDFIRWFLVYSYWHFRFHFIFIAIIIDIIHYFRCIGTLLSWALLHFIAAIFSGWLADIDTPPILLPLAFRSFRRFITLRH